MIDITPQVIEWTKEVEVLGGRVYRSFPQRNLARQTYAIVTPTGYTVTVRDEGEDVVAEASWNVQIIGTDYATLFDILTLITDKYGKKNLRCTGVTPGYSSEYKSYNLMATFTTTVDRRMWTYREGSS